MTIDPTRKEPQHGTDGTFSILPSPNLVEPTTGTSKSKLKSQLTISAVKIHLTYLWFLKTYMCV